VAHNATALYIIQFANYILPLITVPYVVRVLTPTGYGLVAFGQSFIGYFIVFIEYGFSYSATRKISVTRHDPMTVSQTVFSVLGAKLLLCLIGFLVLLLLINLVPVLRQNRILLIILYLAALGNVMFPTWLFQGMERMVNISVINLLIRLLVTVGIFTLIKRPEDYLLYAALSSLGAIFAGTLGIYCAFYYFDLLICLPSWQGIYEVLNEGWTLFLAQASVSLYTVGNPFILGLLTTTSIVGYYSAAEKIVRAIVGLLNPISQAVYPRFSKIAIESRTRMVFWIRKLFYFMGSIGLFLTIILFIMAPIIVKIILGVDYKSSVKVIQIMAALPFIVSFSNVLGIQVMLPLDKDKIYTMLLFLGGIINIIIALILVPIYHQYGMAIAVLLSEVFITLSQLFYCYRSNLLVDC